MNSGRDPGDLGGPAAFPEGRRALWHARWFRTTIIFSIAALTAALTVPSVLRRAGTEDGAAIPAAPPAGPTAAIGDVTTLVWEGESGSAGFSTVEFTAAAASRPGRVRRASAVTPAAPKGTESRAVKSAPAVKKAPESVEAYWVQVGAYRDGETAKRVAQRLREQKYQVQESTVTLPPESADRAAADASAAASGERDRYEVVVTGRSPSEVEAQLSAKGLTSRAAAEGAVITPGLPLGEAVALSRDLSDSGLGVRVRRASPTSGAAPRATGGGAGEALYRVRVGGFPDRAAALTALKELEARGYKPFLTRGNE